jgi:hypothetical protein
MILDKKNAHLLFQYRDDLSGPRWRLGTLDVDANNLEEIYPAVSISYQNRCAITLAKD